MADAAEQGSQIDTVMKEKRLFPPPQEFASRARIKSLEEYRGAVGRSGCRSAEVLGRSGPRGIALVQAVRASARLEGAVCQWFVGGKTNVSYNCLDLHLTAGLGNARRSCGKGSRATRGS